MSTDIYRPAAIDQLQKCRPGGRRLLSQSSRPKTGRHRARGARAGARQFRGRADRGHRRTPARGRGHDGRDPRVACRAQSGRDTVCGGQHDRPGRGEYRQGLWRGVTADRLDSHQNRRRCARRRGAVGALCHRQADQVSGRGREDRRARAVPSRIAWHRASSAWAMCCRWSNRRSAVSIRTRRWSSLARSTRAVSIWTISASSSSRWRRWAAWRA